LGAGTQDALALALLVSHPNPAVALTPALPTLLSGSCRPNKMLARWPRVAVLGRVSKADTSVLPTTVPET
jgi:hypothetical protein